MNSFTVIPIVNHKMSVISVRLWKKEWDEISEKERCSHSISEHAFPNSSSQTKNTIWSRNKNRPSKKSRRCNKIVQLWNMKHRNVIGFIALKAHELRTKHMLTGRPYPTQSRHSKPLAPQRQQRPACMERMQEVYPVKLSERSTTIVANHLGNEFNTKLLLDFHDPILRLAARHGGSCSIWRCGWSGAARLKRRYVNWLDAYAYKTQTIFVCLKLQLMRPSCCSWACHSKNIIIHTNAATQWLSWEAATTVQTTNNTLGTSV